MPGGWWRDPLVHFLAFGVGVAAVEATFGVRAPAADPGAVEEAAPDTVLTVTPERVRALGAALTAALGRAPTPGELDQEVRRWIETELLAREAVALGLHRDDPVIRAHLAAKMAYVLDAREAPGEPTEEALMALYEASAAAFTLEEELTLRQHFLAGAGARERAEDLRTALAAGADPVALGASTDPPPGGPVLRGRTPARLGALFGEAFTAAVRQAPEGAWTVVPSPGGWHVVRVERRVEGRRLSFEESRARLVLRWRADRLAEGTAAAMGALRGRYTVRGWPP